MLLSEVYMLPILEKLSIASLLVGALLWLAAQPAAGQLTAIASTQDLTTSILTSTISSTTSILTSTTPSLPSTSLSRGFPGGMGDAWGPLFKALELGEPPSIPPRLVDSVRRWNTIAIAANALDHTPVAPGENRVFGEQFGPGRTSRALAIVHIAIFDAVNAIAGGCRSYTGLPPASPGASMDAAVAQAAHDALVALFPSQTASFDARLAEDL